MTPWSRAWWAGPLALAILLVTAVPALVFGAVLTVSDYCGGRW